MILSLLGDAAVTITLLLLSWLLSDKLPIYNRYVDLTVGYNHSIPKLEPMWQMFILIWLIAIVYLTALHLILRKAWKMTLLLLFCWFNMMSLVIFVTSFIRFFLPEPRPYFLTKCSPAQPVGWLQSPSFCSVPMRKRDFTSFPSGHASLVWASWTFVFLVLAKTAKTFRRQATKFGPFSKIVVTVLIPLLIPLWMSCDRVRTGNHFPRDVIFGAFVGILSAMFCYGYMRPEIFGDTTKATMVA